MNQDPKKQPKVNPTTHAALTAVIGGYLMYLAYQLLSADAQTNGMSAPLTIIFAVFFGLAGAAVIVYAVRLFLLNRRERKHEEAAPHHDD